jgi:hypothetical protein
MAGEDAPVRRRFLRDMREPCKRVFLAYGIYRDIKVLLCTLRCSGEGFEIGPRGDCLRLEAIGKNDVGYDFGNRLAAKNLPGYP